MMRILIPLATISAILAGCAYMPRGDAGPNPYHSGTGSPNDWSQTYYDDRYWPPVGRGESFPPQIMDGGSLD